MQSGKEGSLGAPTRHALDWKSPDFYDAEKIDEEMRRVADICHGCRRCFNLCDSFPQLFNLIDDSESGELDTVDSKDFKPVVDACTLCDMCYMTKCPYVPPHEFNLDFPHLMLRYRAAEAKAGKTSFTQDQLGKMDRNGTLAAPVAPLVNWGSARKNKITRNLIDNVAGIDAHAELPKFHSRTYVRRAKQDEVAPNPHAPAFGREAVIFPTCFVNYNGPDIGTAARAVLARNGVATEVVYPGCCGMPQLESGKIDEVAKAAEKVAKAFRVHVDAGKPIIALTASCGLMMKTEWPLILPDNEDVAALAAAAKDIDEYVVDIAKDEGLADGMAPVAGGVTVHLACHARAQNMGAKAVEMLRFIPEMKPTILERCSGHGGTFGVVKPTHDLAVKVGKKAVAQAVKANDKYIVSDCPLAAKHLVQGVDETENATPATAMHPVQIMAMAYGLA